MVRVSVTVMAHRTREAFVPELLERLDREAEVIWDRRDDRWDTGRRAMLAYDREATHHLVLQDDAVLPRDLVAGVERALDHVPAPAGTPTPLCLYAGRIRPFRTYVERLVDQARQTTSWLSMAQLHWGVGIVLPTEVIEDCIAWGDRREDIANYDKRISRYLDTQRITVWYPWPSLVDHRDSPSLVPGRTSRGRYAHRFIGADASALDADWSGQTVSLPQLNQHLRHRQTRPLRART
ncbi:hypothetical protein [Streptomonospora litoralis]|uniref:Glycosyltransferase n=1 Tax=Streptomonospora litoralis TaxID=2498135 RepID=A0A4P6Q3Y0_9ACTN|nr:hypothetical protein [Streptomonospora litoralis]QBI53407.1 hypothetical protein EKD16_08065 [Streptomonospora litoralis]